MRRISILCALCALAAGCAPVQSQNAPLPLCGGAPLQIALCEDYPPATRHAPVVERDLAEMNRLGVRTLRVALAWDDIESRPGEFDWAFTDLLFDLAAKHHVELIPYVCYTPKWAALDQGKDYWRQPPSDPATFGRFMSAAAKRYRGRTRSWELWNEPDNSDYWLGTAGQYARLLGAGAAAVRAADPAAKIVLGGISWNEAFLASVLREPGVASAIDVVNLHSYDETWLPEPMEDLPDHIRRVHDLIARYRNRQEIWLAEAGYSDYRGRDGAISASDRSKYAYEHTASYQADALVRMIALAASTGDVRLVAWYRINDLPQTTDVIGDVNNRHLGVVDVTGHDKPAAAALKIIAGAFDGGAAPCDGEVAGCRPLDSVTEVHCFASVDGGVWLFAWIRTYVPGSLEPGETGSAADARRAHVEVSLTRAFILRGCIDARGVTQDVAKASLSGGDTLLDLRLVAGRTYLIQLHAAASGKG